MTARLRVVAGGHELLLDSSQVQRVSTTGAGGDEAVEWESRHVPVIDLAALLGGPVPSEGSRVIVVYGEGVKAIGLAVDAIRGLVQLGPNGVAALPPLSPGFALLFDGIAVEPVEGRHPLCLRSVLDLAALIVVAAQGGEAAHG
jgi:chemotaxis signal transduction protein